jgi:hypothetical protein
MKALLLCHALVLVAGLSRGVAPQLSPLSAGDWGAVNSGLRMAISLVPPTTELLEGPEFYIGIENVGNNDAMVNLGHMISNGKVMFPEAVRLFLTDRQGSTRELQYFDRRYSGVAGRVDDFIVALPAGSVYMIRVSMDRYWSPSTKEWGLKLASGRYQIQARFEGQGARSLNLDTPGIALLNFWKGTLRSNALSFEIP